MKCHCDYKIFKIKVGSATVLKIRYKSSCKYVVNVNCVYVELIDIVLEYNCREEQKKY